MRRTIPKLSTLAIAVTAGCAKVDPMVGDWDATFFSSTGYEPLNMPYMTEITNENGIYDYFLSIDARFTDGGTGTLSFHERFEQGGNVTFEDTNNYAFTTEIVERGVWIVDVPSYDGLLLECSAGGDTMSCLGDDEVGVDYEMDFERKEE